jgi:hypothetical protein
MPILSSLRRRWPILVLLAAASFGGCSSLDTQQRKWIFMASPVHAAELPFGHRALLRPRDHSHLGAHVGEPAAGQRTGAHAVELDDADARQRRLHANSLRAIRSFMISLVPP